MVRDSLDHLENSVFGGHLKSGLEELVLVSSGISMRFNLFISINPLKEPFQKQVSDYPFKILIKTHRFRTAKHRVLVSSGHQLIRSNTSSGLILHYARKLQSSSRAHVFEFSDYRAERGSGFHGISRGFKEFIFCLPSARVCRPPVFTPSPEIAHRHVYNLLGIPWSA